MTDLDLDWDQPPERLQPNAAPCLEDVDRATVLNDRPLSDIVVLQVERDFLEMVYIYKKSSGGGGDALPRSLLHHSVLGHMRLEVPTPPPGGANKDPLYTLSEILRVLFSSAALRNVWEVDRFLAVELPRSYFQTVRSAYAALGGTNSLGLRELDACGYRIASLPFTYEMLLTLSQRYHVPLAEFRATLHDVIRMLFPRIPHELTRRYILTCVPSDDMERITRFVSTTQTLLEYRAFVALHRRYWDVVPGVPLDLALYLRIAAPNTGKVGVVEIVRYVYLSVPHSKVVASSVPLLPPPLLIMNKEAHLTRHWDRAYAYGDLPDTTRHDSDDDNDQDAAPFLNLASHSSSNKVMTLTHLQVLPPVSSKEFTQFNVHTPKGVVKAAVTKPEKGVAKNTLVSLPKEKKTNTRDVPPTLPKVIRTVKTDSGESPSPTTIKKPSLLPQMWTPFGSGLSSPRSRRKDSSENSSQTTPPKRKTVFSPQSVSERTKTATTAIYGAVLFKKASQKVKKKET